MQQDFKPRPAPRSKSGGTLLLGMVVGFLLGLAVAALIAVYFLKTPMPFLEKGKEKPPGAPNLTEGAKPPEKAQQAKADTKPRFDFYRILPGQEEPVTERQVREAQRQAQKTGEPPKETYLLQAGSFQNPADADNLKAKLALIGVEANVEPTNLAEKGMWYRVRVGPYTKLEDINRVRQQMVENGIQVSLVRIKDATAKN
ncbi:MAG TPA: SPOR domain-containing protein [Burkholderiales bacterium]